MIKRLLNIAILCLIMLNANAADENTGEDKKSVELEELNVTAVKQQISVNNQPEASTYISIKDIEQLGIVTLRGVSDVVPNFYMPEYGSRITSTIYVRGIGARMDQPSVGLNVDNVPYLNKDAYDFNISDISSVVMLRGPQSTLYGRNTMGGVINITTLSPMVYQGWRAFAEVGNGGRIRLNAGWFHKFNYNTGLSITGDYAHIKGFFTNEYNKQKIDKENDFGLRAKFHWHSSSKLNLMNVAAANILRQGGYPYEYIGTGKIEYNDTCFYRRFTFTDGLTIGYNNDKFSLTSITSVQHIDDNMTLDQDFLPESYFTLTQKKKETSFTEEVVVKGTASADKYKWLVGAMGFYKHLKMDAPVVFKDMGIKELIEDHRNEFNSSYPISWDSRMFTLNSQFFIPTWGLSAYHESEYRLGNWEFTVGLRLDYERADLDYHSFCNTGYEIYHNENDILNPYRHVDIDIDERGKIKRDFLSLLPKVAVTYIFPSGQGNIYAKFSRGYKAGGFNTQMFSDVLQQKLMAIMGIGAQYKVEDIVSYKPEQSWNYEIGSHIDLPWKDMSMELTTFYIDCRDQQLTMFPDGTTTGRIMTNAGKTRSFGAEVSFYMIPFKNFNFNTTYGYTNAKFRKFFNGITDYKGKTLPYVPSNTLFIQGLYTLNLGRESNRTLVLDLNVRGTGPIYWNEENSLKQNFYAQLGASITLSVGKWEFKLWGKNLTDTTFHTFYFKSMGNEFLQRGLGKNGGLSLKWTL